MTSPLRLLIADDSAVFVEAMRQAVHDTPMLEICAIARDGQEAVELTCKFRPDLVSMDVLMPRLDGLRAVTEIMRRAPTRVLVLTGDPRGQSGQLTFEALRRGAIDLLPKPTGLDRNWTAQRQLVQKLMALGELKFSSDRPSTSTPRSVSMAARAPWHLPAGVGIVSSTGGPAALAQLLPLLPAGFPVPLLLVQHLPVGFVDGLARWLGSIADVEVKVAAQQEPLQGGTLYLAPDHHHLTLDRHNRIYLEPHSGQGHCPSGDRLLSSLAREWGDRGVGVVLTGMGKDGARGLGDMRSAGAMTVAQDEETSVVYGMPQAAKPAAKQVLPLHRIAAALQRFASRSGVG